MSARIWPSHAVSGKQLDKQMHAWEASRGLRLAQPEATRPEVEEYICISRQFGAGGLEIASRLAERLEWAMFDKELLRMMAGDDAVRQRIYASFDERDTGWFEQVVRSAGWPEFARNDYFHRLTRTVLSIARQGRAIFLGRGIHMMLPRSEGHSVRVVAPLEVRVRQVMRRFSVDEQEARREIVQMDRERADFVLTHFRAGVDDPLHYDVVINSERASFNAAVEVILALRKSKAQRSSSA